jgi:succinate dehydrogenase flavin-adding protein (antitoxin of CptAB toxin-antitoxin module)
LLARWYECSSSEVEEYVEILSQTDSGLTEMINICKAYGLTDEEAEGLMTNE